MRARRRAYSLIECLVMMLLVGAALGMISVTLHSLRPADVRLRSNLDDERCFERFVDRWREDIHLASSASIASIEATGRSGNRLRLTIPPNRSVDYSLLEGEISRVVREGNEIQHRESFALHIATAAHWSVDRDRNPRLISLDFGARPSGQFLIAPSAAVSSAVLVADASARVP